MRAHRSRRAGIAGTVALGLLASASCFAQSSGREPHIDGSSVPEFEAPVARLQQALSGRRRDDVETALAIVWMTAYTEGKLTEARGHLRNAVNAGGLNEQEVTSVLVQIRVVDNQLAGRAANPQQ